MPIIKASTVDPLFYFNYNGVDYQRGLYQLIYRDDQRDGSGDIDETTIKVGLKYPSPNHEVFIASTLVSNWKDGDNSDIPFADLSTLLTAFSTLVFKIAGGTASSTLPPITGDVTLDSTYDEKYLTFNSPDDIVVTVDKTGLSNTFSTEGVNVGSGSVIFVEAGGAEIVMAVGENDPVLDTGNRMEKDDTFTLRRIQGTDILQLRGTLTISPETQTFVERVEALGGTVEEQQDLSLFLDTQDNI